VVIYNVTIKVAHGIATDWVKWMKEVHIPDLLSTGLFNDSRLCRLLDHEEEDGVTYVAQYFCDNEHQYRSYLELHAPEMRERAVKMFGDKFIAMRTAMEAI